MLTIDEIREKIAPICKEYGVKRAWLFGSYARGDATEDSDVDIRIEETEGNQKLCGMFELGGLYSDLEAVFPSGIDLITKVPDDKWSYIFRKNVLKDEVLIYENQ